MNAKVEAYHGEPAVMINGVAYPPMTIVPEIRICPEHVKKYAEANMKLYFPYAVTRWAYPEKRWTDENGVEHVEPSGIEIFKRDAEEIFKQVPDAYLMLRLTIDPPTDWILSHPDDMILYSDGKHHPTILSCYMREEELPGMYSLCSEAFREDASKALNEYFDEFEEWEYKDRVVGFFLCAAGTSEWYYPEGNLLTDFEQGIYGDFSPSFRKEFGRILKEKYGTEEKLRKAWNDPTATFENPKIPNLEERRYTVIDDGILEALLSLESAHRIVGKKIELNPKGEGFIGTFLNANTHQHVADFFNAWHQGTANTIVRLAKVIKDRYPEMLVGAFYGAMGTTDYYQFGTAGGTLQILDSGYIDFLGSAGSYNNREPGNYTAQREMQDSFRLRNEIYFIEADNRTHYFDDISRKGFCLYNVEDTKTTFKRDLGRVLCEDVQGWYFDFYTWVNQRHGPVENMDEHWMTREGFFDFLKEQGEISKFAYSLDRTKKNEIALLYDTESIHYASQIVDAMFCDIYRSSDLGRIGAPVDYYYHNDMSRENMPDYKLYIAINLFHLTEQERQDIISKAKKNHASIVWLYAPGFINPDADTIMDNENISALTGMKVGRYEDTIDPTFDLTEEGEQQMTYADPTLKYGYIDRKVTSGVWMGSIFPPPNFRPLPTAYANPGFYIEDDTATVLGRYSIDGKAAFAMKEMDGYTSYYSAAPFLRSEILQSIAEKAGVHLYVKTDDHITANENFVMIHAGFTGKRTIYFKEPCSPFECYERKFYAENVTELEVNMKRGETLMFSLKGAF